VIIGKSQVDAIVQGAKRLSWAATVLLAGKICHARKKIEKAKEIHVSDCQ
jgi:hypothetical protein